MAVHNDTFLRALRRRPTPYTPVWLMRQAGRYLPEYNRVRNQAGSFLALAKNPTLACEVTLQPLRRFPLDAAILFSDILTIPDAMGLGLSFHEGEGPRFAHTVGDEASIDRLRVPDRGGLDYVYEAVATIKRALDGSVPLIGFAGSPFTLACYMIEGRGSQDDFARVRRFVAQRPDLMDRLVAINARAVASYLNEQIDAGADAVMLFDTWGGLLSTGAYRRFSLEPMRTVLRELRLDTPSIVFTKGGGQWLDELAGCGTDAVGLDWTVDLSRARSTIGARVALQGNLDPVVLTTDAATVAREAERIVREAGPAPGHIFNLGHGITPAASPDLVDVLVRTVHDVSRRNG
ncbi:MAG TPA: uroporphyrinogen decarboxylase [Casimicrobiaceae bacterium]|nr:uroporphyrinogen decarboxylase [Casimicrobiaceae bacterium]